MEFDAHFSTGEVNNHLFTIATVATTNPFMPGPGFTPGEVLFILHMLSRPGDLRSHASENSGPEMPNPIEALGDEYRIEKEMANPLGRAQKARKTS
jgi:hypothetical protein